MNWCLSGATVSRTRTVLQTGVLGLKTTSDCDRINLLQLQCQLPDIMIRPLLLYNPSTYYSSTNFSSSSHAGCSDRLKVHISLCTIQKQIPTRGTKQSTETYSRRHRAAYCLSSFTAIYRGLKKKIQVPTEQVREELDKQVNTKKKKKKVNSK